MNLKKKHWNIFLLRNHDNDEFPNESVKEAVNKVAANHDGKINSTKFQCFQIVNKQICVSRISNYIICFCTSSIPNTVKFAFKKK